MVTCSTVAHSAKTGIRPLHGAYALHHRSAIAVQLKPLGVDSVHHSKALLSTVL